MSEVNLIIPEALEAFEVYPFQYSSGLGIELSSFEDYSCFSDDIEIGFHIVSKFSDNVANELKRVDYSISLVNFSDASALIHARIDNDLIYQLDVEQMQTIVGFILNNAVKISADSGAGKAAQYLIDTLGFVEPASVMIEPERRIEMIVSDDTHPIVTQYTFPSMVLTMYSPGEGSSSHPKTTPMVIVTSSNDINTIQKLFTDTETHSLYRFL